MAFVFAFFILISAGLALCTGVAHAARPLERRLATLRLLSLTAILACVSCAFAGFANSFANVVHAPPDTSLEAMAQITAGGLQEMAFGPMVGFALLAVAWLAATVGARKQL